MPETFATRFSAQRAARRFLKNQAAKEGREFETIKSITADGEQWTYKTLYVGPGDDGDERIEVDPAEVPAFVKDAFPTAEQIAKAKVWVAEADAQKPRRKPVQAVSAPAAAHAQETAATAPAVKLRGKNAILVEMVSRPGGATMGELLDATGWAACRATLGKVCRKAGLALTGDAGKGRDKRFVAA